MIAGRPAWRHAAAALLAALPVLAPAAEQHEQADVPFVVTPPNVVEAMLKIAGVTARDYVIDLGSGDGRIVITAAKQYGARGLGVEIDPHLVDTARQHARREGVADRVRFAVENLFATELDGATVLTMYLFPRVMAQLRPRLFAELKPGARIVSHEFNMDDWPADGRVTVPVPDKPYGPPASDVFLWIMPANAAGVWRWRAADVDYEMTIAQTFQVLEGMAMAGGRAGRVEQGRMRGEEIRLVLTTDVGGRVEHQELTGRVTGESISGRIRTAGGERDWQATRARRGNIDIKQ